MNKNENLATILAGELKGDILKYSDAKTFTLFKQEDAEEWVNRKQLDPDKWYAWKDKARRAAGNEPKVGDIVKAIWYKHEDLGYQYFKVVKIHEFNAEYETKGKNIKDIIVAYERINI